MKHPTKHTEDFFAKHEEYSKLPMWGKTLCVQAFITTIQEDAVKSTTKAIGNSRVAHLPSFVLGMAVNALLVAGVVAAQHPETFTQLWTYIHDICL